MKGHINVDTPFGAMKLPISKEGGTTRLKKNREDGGDDDDDERLLGANSIYNKPNRPCKFLRLLMTEKVLIGYYNVLKISKRKSSWLKLVRATHEKHALLGVTYPYIIVL
ncbi:hypothetical protein PVK06_037008 [Gossypium arboreum]|uniref:Uncharacterized protein n=1 Tax=Gossypium arboreum TaxID=29729 RepID=A0ABR0NNK3_GOSAR|nr:hypothetical protein PVK06_037008 [Gossypium arboreum]